MTSKAWDVVWGPDDARPVEGEQELPEEFQPRLEAATERYAEVLDKLATGEDDHA